MMNGTETFINRNGSLSLNRGKMSIESVIKDCLDKLSSDDRKRLEQFEKLLEPQTEAHYSFNVVGPAFYGENGAYNAALKEINAQFGSDDAKINNKAKLRKVLLSYMKTFFDRAYPAISKVIEDETKGMADERRFELYAHHFDRMAPTVLPGINQAVPMAGLLELFSQNREMSALQLKEQLDELRQGHKKGVADWLKSQLITEYLSSPTLQMAGFASYVIRQFEKAGYRFRDDAAKVNFMRLPIEKIVEAYQKLKLLSQLDPLAAYGLVRQDQGQAKVLPFERAA